MHKQKEIILISVMGLFYSMLPHWVDFDNSMGKGTAKYEACLHDKADYFFGVYPKQLLDFFRQLYLQNNQVTPRIFRRNRIPRRIHQIWLGPKKIPAYYESYKQSWLRYHPGWEYKLWTDEDVKKLTLHNRALYDMTNNYAGKADIVRYEILYQFGGIYADVDIGCIKSFEKLNRCYDFYCGIAPLQMFVMCVCNALIAVVPGHPILKHCIETMQYEKGDVPFYFKTGSIHLTKSIWEVAHVHSDYVNIVLPTSCFYPIIEKPLTMQQVKDELLKKPEAFCVHYWDANW